jgi:putative transposase
LEVAPLVLDKGYGSLTIRLDEKFSLVSKLKGSHCAKRICQVFDIHRSSYKYWQRQSKKPSLQQAQINSEVRAAFKVSNVSVGSRNIASMVTTNDFPLSRFRARSIMKKLGLRSSQPSAPKYKKSNNEHLAVPNTLNREFDVKNPNQIWCGDVTYIWIEKRWAFNDCT